MDAYSQAVRFLKVIAWLASGFLALIGVLVLVSATQMSQSAGVPIATGIGCLFVAVLAWVSGMILPELIEVLLAIEENTRP